MSTSIGKTSKSFFVKLLVGIIILPFVFWGMGDVFRGGNQNIIASIESNKITTQEFIDYLNKLNLNEEEKKNIKKTNLLNRIISEYIGRKIIGFEVENLDIQLSNKSLKEIITNEKAFFKENKFSRTAYEKFLLESSISAPAFERNIAEQEKKRQLLSFLSDGSKIPFFLVKNEFKKENQIKDIKYLNLNNFYANKKPTEEEIKKVYEKNKKFFVEDYKSISFAEITPEILTGTKELDENFFKQLDKIENDILDDKAIKVIAKDSNIKLNITKEININKLDKDGLKFNGLNDDLFKQFFSIKKIKSPVIINKNNKYYLIEVSTLTKKNLNINNKKVRKMLNDQFLIKNKLEFSTKIKNDIEEKLYNLDRMKSFAKTNNIEILDLKIENINENNVFSKEMIVRIFQTNNKKFDLITDSTLSKNFIIYVTNTKYKELKKKSQDYKKYKAKAKLTFARQIYSLYDQGVNKKYNVKLNDKTIDRLKNSF